MPAGCPWSRSRIRSRAPRGIGVHRPSICSGPSASWRKAVYATGIYGASRIWSHARYWRPPAQTPEPVRSTAGAVAALAVLDVEVEVVAVVVVVAGAEHRGEIFAAIGAHIVEEAAGAEGEQAGLAHV